MFTLSGTGERRVTPTNLTAQSMFLVINKHFLFNLLRILESS